MESSGMGSWAQYQRSVAVFMSFALIIQLSGCYSTKSLNVSDIPQSGTWYVHSGKATCRIDSVIFSDGIFSGRIAVPEENGKNSNKGIDKTHSKKGKSVKYHIYISPGSGVSFNDKIISVPDQYITRIEKKIPEPKKTNALIAGCSIWFIGTVILLVLIISKADDTEKAHVDMGFCSTGQP